MRKEEEYTRDLSSLFDEAYDVDSTPMQDSLETESERYVNKEFYSEGGLKKIEKCLDCRTNRIVAMATPKNSTDKKKVEAFLREAKLNAALQHPNIVPVYDLGLDEGVPWFTMKFISGKSLEELISELKKGEKNRLEDLNERLDIFLKVCEAISYSHSLGILHLDLKPDNIRISEYGDVVVCDWGLADVEATVCDETLLEYCSLVEYDLDLMTVDGVVKGSVGYMAPEQTGLTDMRKGTHTDVFSLGTLLYSLLCFERAFDGCSFEEVIKKTADCEFPKPSEIDPEIPYSLEAVCLKAMSLKIEDRYASVSELKNEIQAYRNGFATGAENASVIRALKLFYLRNRIVSTVSILALILFAVLSVVSVNHLSLSKKNAVQLAEKMSLEAEYHRKINKDAAPLFLERAQTSYKAHALEDALNFSTSAVELDGSLVEGWLIKGKVHFILEQFNGAKKALTKAGYKGHLLTIAEEYASLKKGDSIKLPIEEYVNIMDKLHAIKDFDLFGKMTHRKCYSDITLDDRIKFVKGVVELRHRKKIQKRNYKFNFNFNRETGHLDVSNNPWLKTILCLQNFPARSADFSRTGINNSICFRAQKLEKLDISSTDIIELQTMENRTLKELNIANCGIQNLTPIYSFPIEKLDIRNTGIRSLVLTQRFRKLKEVHVNKGQFEEWHLKRVPKSVKVVIHGK